MLIKKIILKSVVQTIGKKTTCPAQDLGFGIWNLRFGIYNCGGVTEKPKE